jgi:hypothetical protein
MKKLTGYVLVQETGFGVPNLVVAAYNSQKSVRTGIAGYENKQSFSIDDLGMRLGSVITDGDGRFVVSSEDLEFEGNESRPDLSIVVFAPEDVQAMDRPYPLPPEQRILYISAAPISDAGAEESFVIRLLQAQLDSYHIMADQAANQGTTQSARLASAVSSVWTFRDSLRAQISPRLKEEQKSSDARRQVAQDQVRNLSGIPVHLRDNALTSGSLLIMGRSELKDKLQQKQADAMAQGLKRMAQTPPTLRIQFTEGDLADLGLRKDGQTIAGEVDPIKLASKVRSIIKAFDLVRVRSLSDPSPDELALKYLSAPSDTSAPGVAKQ